jgi:hypothetical protein
MGKVIGDKPFNHHYHASSHQEEDTVMIPTTWQKGIFIR